MSNLGDRTKYVGCSELAACTGYGGFETTALDKWEEKTGRRPGFKGNHHTKRGTFHEAAVIRLHKQETGCKVENRQAEYVHAKAPWWKGHADGEIPEHPSDPATFQGPGILEVKAPSTRSLDRLRDAGLPNDYIFQAHGLCGLSGYSWMRWAMLDYDNHRTISWDIPFDPEFFARLEPEIEKFWKCVETDTPPDEVPPQLDPPQVDGELKIYSGEKWDTAGMNIVGVYETYTDAKKNWDEEKPKLVKFMEDNGLSKAQIGEFCKLVYTVPKAPRRFWQGEKAVDWVSHLCSLIRKGDMDEAARLAKGFRPSNFYTEKWVRSLRPYPVNMGGEG